GSPGGDNARGRGGRQGLSHSRHRSRLVHGGGGRLRVPARPQRLRQDDTAAHRGGPRAGLARAGDARRRAGRGRPSAPAQDRRRLPGRSSAAVDDIAPERGARAQATRPRRRRARRHRAPLSRRRGPRRFRGLLSGQGLRWHAAARRYRPRACHRARRLADGRALRGARCPESPDHAERSPPDLAGDRPHDPLRHAFHRRSGRHRHHPRHAVGAPLAHSRADPKRRPHRPRAARRRPQYDDHGRGRAPAGRRSIRSMSPIVIRRVRLGAASILLTYLVLHFSNHALGLVSLAAMEGARPWFLAIWRNPIGTVALYGAITVHGVLALWLLYRRRSLRMPAWEALQYGLGLSLPALLTAHVVGTQIAWWQTGAEDRYARILFAMWVAAPERAAWQALALVVAWTHASIGVHYWLRFRPWYPRVATSLFAIALLLPSAALAGFVAAGHEVSALARTPGWTHAMLQETHAPTPAQAAMLARIRTTFFDAYLIALVAVLCARAARQLWQRRRSIRVSYPGDRVVTVPVGFTILEASRTAGIPHASVCGGRGRCSTCR